MNKGIIESIVYYSPNPRNSIKGMSGGLLKTL